jgi:asparagine N-glycosylation enzyme membrane subunit Stt3
MMGCWQASSVCEGFLSVLALLQLLLMFRVLLFQL